MSILPARLKALSLQICLIVSFIYSLFLPTNVWATTFNLALPAEIQVNTSFEINLNITAQPNTTYSIKSRIGNSPSKLTQGQTLGSDGTSWLGDNDAWVKFPQVTTDANGELVGKINARSSANASIGQNYVVIRIHTGSTSTDSATYTIDLKEAPPTPVEVVPAVVHDGRPILSEFMAQPSDGKEWVEIKNQSNYEADISGWFIDDEPGKSSPTLINPGTIIAPNGYFVLTLISSKLNDLTDMVRLLKPDQTEVESYRYQSTEKGSSWSKDSGGNWFISSPTPGSENVANIAAKPAALTTTKSTPNKLEAPEETTIDIVSTAPVLAAATQEAKLNKSTATVSGSFAKKIVKPASVLSLPLIVLGFVLLAFGTAVLIKQQVKSKTHLPPSAKIVE